tara:strand:- start:180 stop:533 length:354 start_codon:yes stop_codon:yes gene_type:complete
MDQAKAKLENNNLPFIDKTETALGFLRSIGVLPIKRATLNGHLHNSYSAMLVEALEQGTTIDVPTRRQADLHELGHTTMLVKWLDTSVELNVLITKNGSKNAQGALELGNLFKQIID